MRFSVGIKLGFWLALLGALSTALTGYYIYDRSRDLLIKSSQDKLLTATQVLAQRFNGTLSHISDDVRFVALLPQVQQLANASGPRQAQQEQGRVLAAIFTGLLSSRPEYSQVRLIGAADHGRELIRVDRANDSVTGSLVVGGAALQEKSHQPYFFETLRLPSGQFYVSQIGLNQEQGAHHGFGKPTIRIAAPVHSLAGVIFGVVVIDVDLGDLFDLIRADLPQDLKLLLTNKRGDYLIHPDAAKTFGFETGRQFLIQDELPDTLPVLEGRSQHVMLESADATVLGQPSLAAFVRVPFGLLVEQRFVVLGLYTPLENVLAQSKTLGLGVVQLTLLFIALASVVALVLARVLAKPLNLMAHTVGLHALGRPIAALPVERDDEVGDLARSFRSMTMQLDAQVTEVQAAEAKLHAILNYAPVGIWLVGVDGRYRFVNKTICDSIGIAEERFLSCRHLPELLGEELAAARQRADAECLAQPGAHRSQETLNFVDGRPHLVEVTRVKLLGAGNEPVGVIAIATDITERKRAEQDLARASEELAGREALLKRIMDTSSVAIYLVDMSGRITHANRRMAEMFGLPQASLIGKAYVDLVHPSEQAVAGRNMSAMLTNRLSSVDLERRYLRGDQSSFWGHLTGQHFLTSTGEELGLVGVIADITESRRAQQREQHHQRVLQLLSEKAPLSAVLGLIVREVEALDPSKLCSILLLDDDGQHLRQGAAPSLPDYFNQAIDGLAIGPSVGACGTAAFTGQRVVVDDIASHPDMLPFLELARRAGLGACWSQPILSAQGRVLGTFAVYHRQQSTPTPADLQLIEDEARLAALAIDRTRADMRLQLAASVFTHAREGIAITDATGTLIEVNNTFTHITGFSREEALGQNLRVLKSGRHGPEFYASMWRDLTGNGYWDGEIWNRRKNGDVYAQMITISAVRDAEGRTQNYVSLFTDITPMKEHQRQLEHIAHYDALTSQPNRVLLADRLQQAMAQSQRRNESLAVAFLDLDGFKAVNDRHGHDVGDQLLITLAQRMRAALREGDTLSRIGGDEFVAVLVDLERPQDCEPVLERLLQAAASPLTVGESVLQVSASIGVTVYPQDAADADQLMRHADQAMYVAKQAGKNRYHLFDVAHDEAVKTQRESLEHIAQALERREFVLFYQPKVNMRSGAVIGAEALIRWQHPERGLLSPAAFLPVTEDHDISVKIGEWVIATALRQMIAWRESGLDLPVSVNISARQLQQENFSERLAELLATHPEVQPGRLELEILETSAMEDIAQVSQVMMACRAVGVSFALDDFGTGYSSLTYLKRLPAEVLKIDQSFVRDMLEDADDLAIIRGVVGLASAFRRQVIAEGVETVAHGEMLLSLGCELAQGYGIASPMPAADFPAWAANWRPDAAWRR